MATYASLQDLIARFGADEVIRHLDRDRDGVADPDTVSQILADVSALIDGYLAGRYRLPLAGAGALLTGLACDLARAAYLGASLAVDGPEAAAAKAARATLRDIADGRVVLAAGDATAAVAGGLLSRPGLSTVADAVAEYLR